MSILGTHGRRPGGCHIVALGFFVKGSSDFFSGSLRKGSVEQRRVQVRLGYSAEACSGADGRGSVWQRRVQVRLG